MNVEHNIHGSALDNCKLNRQCLRQVNKFYEQIRHQSFLPRVNSLDQREALIG